MVLWSLQQTMGTIPTIAKGLAIVAQPEFEAITLLSFLHFCPVSVSCWYFALHRVALSLLGLASGRHVMQLQDMLACAAHPVAGNYFLMGE